MTSRKKTASTVRVAHRAFDTVYGTLACNAKRQKVANTDVALPRRSHVDRLTRLLGVYVGGTVKAGFLGATIPVAALAFDGRIANVVNATALVTF